MVLTNRELGAILKLANVVANADGKFSNEEGLVMTAELARFGASIEKMKLLAAIGDSMSPVESCMVVSHMTTEEKKHVAAFLGSIIAADGKIEDSEIEVWALISSICQLPTMTLAEAISFWN